MKIVRYILVIFSYIWGCFWLVSGGCGGGGGEKDTDTVESDLTEVDIIDQNIDIPADEITGENINFDWLDEQCYGRWIPMERTGANIVYQIDRSTLMLEPLDGHEPTPEEMGSCSTFNYAPATGITFETWWNHVSGTINTLAVDYQDKIKQGLVLYPGPGMIGEVTGVDAVRMCDGPVTRPVNMCDPGFDTGGQIATALEDGDSVPVCSGGFAPMRKGLEISSHALEREDYVPRAVIVVARSGPNCNLSMPRCTENECTVEINYCDGTQGTIGCQDSVLTIETIRNIHDNEGVDIYIVGLPGSEAFSGYFNEMAEAGGTALEGDTKYYAVTQPNELEAKLREILDGKVVCLFHLESTPSDLTGINVLVDGRPLKRDDADGYAFYPDDGIVELLGSSCEAFLDGSISEVAFLEGCPPYGG